jgi:hypothetical protein
MAAKKASSNSDTAKKPATKPGKALESKTGAGEAVAERSKDAKKTRPASKASSTASAAKKSSAPAKASSGGSRSAAKSSKSAGAKSKASGAKASKSAKTSSGETSLAKKVVRRVKSTAEGAVALAASVLGKNDKKAKTKRD